MPTPAAPEPVVPTLAPSREFRTGAHQVLLASNGRDTFYVSEIQRAISGPGSPLARFLPAATYNAGDRAAGKAGGVAYAISPAEIASARPLRSAVLAQPGAVALTRSEIAAFREAIRLFLAADSTLTPLQLQCRRELRLPDPAREPDAYWVVGAGFERRLIILWGCERFARTSVALDRVLAHLETCEMNREDKQQLGLQLALRREEALARFLALPARGSTGLKLRGEGEPLPAKAIKPFVTFGNSEFTAFDTAAKAFVAKAADPATTPFEAEVRRDFLLPSLAAAPERFFRHGPRLLIDASPLDASKCISPAPLDDNVNEDTPPLNRQLAKRVKFQGMAYVYAASALAAAAAITAGILIFGPDREPPTLLEAKTNGPRQIAVTFSEPLATGPAQNSVAFVGDKRKIALVRLDPANPAILIVEPATPLKDGEDYALDLSAAITDKAKNPLKRSTAEFKYYDDAPPVLDPARGVSAGGKSARDLVLTFTKPIDDASLNPSSFTIRPVSGGEPGKAVRIDAAVLDPDVAEGTRVILTAEEDLQSRRPYVLSIRGVKDRAVKPNRIEIQDHAFEYKDILPPSVREIIATGATYTLQLTFSKPLDPATAQAVASYEVRPVGTDAKPLRLVPSGGITLDEQGSVVTIRLERDLLSAGQHKLVVKQALDRNGNRLEKPLERSFAFGDASSRGSPKILSVVSEERSSRIVLEFDRGVSAATAKDLKHFRLLNRDKLDAGIALTEVAANAEDSRKVTLTLARAPEGGATYFIRTEGLEDVFGTKQTDPEQKDFRPRQFTIKASAILPTTQQPILVGNNQVRVRFDGVMSKETVTVPANFIVIPAEAGTIQKIDHIVKKTDTGTSYTEVTLVFAAPLAAAVRVGANNLTIDGDISGVIYKLTPKPAVRQ